MLAQSGLYRRIRLTRGAVSEHVPGSRDVMRVCQAAILQRSRAPGLAQDRPAKKLKITLRKTRNEESQRPEASAAPTQEVVAPQSAVREMSVRQAKRFKNLMEDGREVLEVLEALAASHVRGPKRFETPFAILVPSPLVLVCVLTAATSLRAGECGGPEEYWHRVRGQASTKQHPLKRAGRCLCLDFPMERPD